MTLLSFGCFCIEILTTQDGFIAKFDVNKCWGKFHKSSLFIHCVWDSQCILWVWVYLNYVTCYLVSVEKKYFFGKKWKLYYDETGESWKYPYQPTKIHKQCKVIPFCKNPYINRISEILPWKFKEFFEIGNKRKC